MALLRDPRNTVRFVQRPRVAFLSWVSEFNVSNLRWDILAGVTIAAFSIPEDLAYASLAGLPPQTGLYASIAGMIAYAIFGTSRTMVVSVTSAISIMVAAQLAILGITDPARYLAIAGLIALMVGAIAFTAGFFRLGFLVNFISEPVVKGFLAGAAVYIVISQLPKLVGVSGTTGTLFQRGVDVFSRIGLWNLVSIAMGIGGIAFLIGSRKKFPRLPAPLILMVVSILALGIFAIRYPGVPVVGPLPEGLPVFTIPLVTSVDIVPLVPISLSIFLITYVEAIVVARAFAMNHRYRIDPNQELHALAISNISAGMFQGYVVGGSMSRTAINEDLGGRTPLVGVTAAVVMVAFLYYTRLIAGLPLAILAAIVFVAAIQLFDFSYIGKLRKISRLEFIAAALTFVAVIFLGFLEGVLTGVFFSMLALVATISRPSIAILGQIPGTASFGDIAYYPQAEQVPGVLVFRVNGNIIFANAESIRDRVLELADTGEPPVRYFIFDLESSPYIDVTGSRMLVALSRDLEKRGIGLSYVLLTGEAADILRLDETTRDLLIHSRETTIADIIRTLQESGEGSGTEGQDEK